MMEPAHDEDLLVARARLGDTDAFQELMRRSASASKRLAVSILRNTDDAEDAVQEAFSKAWEHVPRFQGDSRFSTWLTRIVVNQCLMQLRRVKRNPSVPFEEHPVEDDRTSVSVPDSAAGPESDLARDEMIAAVRREVSRLPKLLREPLELRDLQERPIEEVAERLSLSVPAVKSRLLRARAELRARLNRYLTVNRAASVPI